MADGDPLMRHGGGGGGGAAGEKRARTFVDGATAEEDGLLLLLDGLSPSPAKKINRSSGDLLDATGEDGKVLPELLSDHGGNTVTSTWPKPSARKQVLTFGASWDNKSDVDFLNRSTDAQDIDGAGAGAGFAGIIAGSNSNTFEAGSKSSVPRRHSDPPVRAPALAPAESTASGPGTGTGSGTETGTGAHARGLLPTRLGRRPNSTGSSSAPYPSSSYMRSGTILAAGAGSSNARRGGAVGAHAQAMELGLRASNILAGVEMGMDMDMSMQGKEQGKGGAKVIATTELKVEMDADALLLPAVDVRDMRVAMASSPAGSVESDFWLGDGAGAAEGDENDGFDPMEAAHAAVDRLMASAGSTTAAGNSRSAAGAADGGVDGGGRDAKLLEELLLDGLGLQKAGAATGAGASKTKRRRRAKGSMTDSNSALGVVEPTDDFPSTPANAAGHDNANADGGGGVNMSRKQPSSKSRNSSGGNGGGGSSSSSRCKKGRAIGGPSPAPSWASSASASSTPLSSLSSNGRSSGGGGSSSSGSTPQSVGGFSNTSPGSSISIASMTLAPSLWKLVERGDICPFEDCAFTEEFLKKKELAKKRKADKDKKQRTNPEEEGGKGQEAALLEIENLGVGILGGAGPGNSGDVDVGGGAPHGGGGGEGGVGGVGTLKVRREAMVLQEADAGNRPAGVEGEENKSISRCRHFHTLCGCRHTRGALKGRLFQTNQLDKARNHQKKHAHADALALASTSPAGGGAGGPAAETPSPMPMPLPSSQESTGSFAWGSQPEANTDPLSQGTSQSHQDMEAVTPVPSSQGRRSTVSRKSLDKGGNALDGDCEDIVIDNGSGIRDGTNGFLDDTEDESGVESSAGKRRSRGPAGVGTGDGGTGTSPPSKSSGPGGSSALERSGTLDSVGSGVGGGGSGAGTGAGAGAGGLNSRDGRRTWTDAESDRLREVVEHSAAGEDRKNWQWVAARVCEVSGAGRKTPSQCKMRWERILNPGVKRGLWTKEEDEKLKEVAAAMDYKWSHVAKMMGGRTYKQCRERYTNYLKEGLNVGPWSKEEDRLLLTMHAQIGNKWAEIARHLKDRSENMIKNEYMKLSRDASHRRLKSDQDVMDGVEPAADGDSKKVKKRGGKPKPGTQESAVTNPTAVAVAVANDNTKDGVKQNGGGERGGHRSTGHFSAATQVGEGMAEAAMPAGEHYFSSLSSTSIDVGVGSTALLHQQPPPPPPPPPPQLGLGHGFQGVDPFVDNGARGGGGDAVGGPNVAVSSAVTAMAVASATACDHSSLNLLLPSTPRHALTAHGSNVEVFSGTGAGSGTSSGGAGVPIADGVAAAFADGRVPIAAAADRAPCPSGVVGVGVGVGGAGGGYLVPNSHPPPAGSTTSDGGDVGERGAAFRT